MSDIDKYIPSVFKEKKWGKKEGGEFIVDGFTFKGKRSFNIVFERFKESMRKCNQSDINRIQFKVLDSRTQGTGLEIDVEMEERGSRGIAVLKLYGPSSKKKESVVMVSKNKESESKYVTILAQKIIKPLMIKVLDEEIPDQSTSNSDVNISVLDEKSSHAGQLSQVEQ